MSFVQNSDTKSFINAVMILKGAGTFKRDYEIAHDLGMKPTNMSFIMNGQRNIPKAKYELFKEKYPTLSSLTLDINERKSGTGDISDIVKNKSDIHVTSPPARGDTGETIRLLAQSNMELAKTNSQQQQTIAHLLKRIDALQKREPATVHKLPKAKAAHR